MTLPFIYICSTMRSGSTFLQELLTKPPYSLILSEPRFKGGNFVFNKENVQQVKSAGINNFSGGSLKDVMSRLNSTITQVGVKEIRNCGWRAYLDTFVGEIRVLIPVRDPRDIYISAYGVMQRNNSWSPRFGFSPEGLYKELLPELNVQKELCTATFTMVVKYEELCMDFENKYNDIKNFVNSPIPAVGDIGEFHMMIPAGQHEVNTHLGKVTTKSVNRWQTIKDEELLFQANSFFDLMTDYNNRWGYK